MLSTKNINLSKWHTGTCCACHVLEVCVRDSYDLTYHYGVAFAFTL